MAFIFGDGFDQYLMSNGTPILKWDGYVNFGGGTLTMSVAPGNGRPSATDSLTGGLAIASGNNANGAAYLRKNLNKNCASLYVGFAALWANATGSGIGGAINDCVLLEFLDVANWQCDLRITNTGQLYFTRNGTAIGTPSASLLTTNHWYYIEVGVTFSATVGTITLLVNGATWLTLTGLNNITSGNAYANAIYLGSIMLSGNNSPIMQYDDLYIVDGTGPSLNTFLGDIRVRDELPTGNGTQNDYSTNFAPWAASTAYAKYTTITDGTNIWRCTTVGTSGGSISWPGSPTIGQTKVDNTVTWTCVANSALQWVAVNEPSPDGDSSYIASNTVGNQSRFTYPSTVGTSVLAVLVNMYARKDDAGYRAIRAVAKSGSTIGDNGSDFYLGNTAQIYQGVLATDPNTGVAWTVSGVNAAEFGVKTTV